MSRLQRYLSSPLQAAAGIDVAFHTFPFRGVAVAAAAISAAVGAGAIVWWLVDGRSLVPVGDGQRPIHPHAAFGLLLLAAALMAAVTRRVAPAAVLAALVLALGKLTLLDGITPAAAAAAPFLTPSGSLPATMSAQVALCLVGLSVAILGLLREARAPLAATIASLVAAFGAMSLLGYGVDLEPLYGWSGINRMAWHTAATITVLSAGVLAAIVADSAARAPGLLPEWLHVPVGVFTAAGGLILWHATTSELVSRQVRPTSAGSGATLIVALAGSVLTAAVVRLWVVAQRRKTGLERAALEIRTLSGLVPICAWCKSIRDDRGYWEELEQYLSSRADVLFTHGICPGCASENDPGATGRPG